MIVSFGCHEETSKIPECSMTPLFLGLSLCFRSLTVSVEDTLSEIRS